MDRLGERNWMPDACTLLDSEARWPHPHRGAKDLAIERELGVRPARLYQLLHRAAASREGQSYDPVTAHRVMRMLSASAHILPTLSPPSHPFPHLVNP